MEQERTAFAALSSTKQVAARLSSTFKHLLLCPEAQFPATRAGIRAGTLSTAKQTLLLNTIHTPTPSGGTAAMTTVAINGPRQ